MILDIIFIAYILVFIISISGAVRVLKESIMESLFNRSTPDIEIKPFECPLCMTWWCGIIYLLISGNFSLFGIFYVAVIANFASKGNIIEESFYFVSDVVIKLFNWILK